MAIRCRIFASSTLQSLGNCRCAKYCCSNIRAVCAHDFDGRVGCHRRGGMSVVNEDVARLNRLNWDFPQAGTAQGSIHKFHWFPGNFIPQIPAALIEILSAPGDPVLDPFGGSGTTSIEARSEEHPSELPSLILL